MNYTHSISWFDGICKTCGSEVTEEPSESFRDYRNRCTNPDCRHHIWHYVYDTDIEEYYTHN